MLPKEGIETMVDAKFCDSDVFAIKYEKCENWSDNMWENCLLQWLTNLMLKSFYLNYGPKFLSGFMTSQAYNCPFSDNYVIVICYCCETPLSSWLKRKPFLKIAVGYQFRLFKFLAYYSYFRIWLRFSYI